MTGSTHDGRAGRGSVARSANCVKAKGPRSNDRGKKGMQDLDSPEVRVVAEFARIPGGFGLRA